MKTQAYAIARTARVILYLLIALSVLSVTALGQRHGILMAQVDMGGGGGGGGGGGLSSVTFELYRAQADCCDECKKPPERPCRKCGCVIARNLVESKTLKSSGKVEFKDLPPGRYLVVNDAGYEKFIEVKDNAKEDLGTLAVDNGRPGNRYHRMPMPPVPPQP